MFIAELEHPEFKSYNLSSLRTGIMGLICRHTTLIYLAGSTCPVEVMKRVINQMYMKDITICYGMTETSRKVVNIVD